MNIGLSFSIFGKRTCAMGGSPAHPAERHFAQCRQFGIDAVELVIMDDYIAPGDWRHLENARREFVERTGGKPYRSPLPDSLIAPRYPEQGG